MAEPSFASHLRTAIINQRMYPSGSPIVERSVGQILQTLQSVLEGSDRVTLTNRGGKIFVNNKEVPDGAPLSPLLDEHGAQSLVFLPGLAAHEVARFVELMAQKKIPAGKMDAWLEENKVAHIQVDKVTLVEVADGEKVIKDVDLLFDGVKDFPQLVGSLRSAYDLIGQIPDPQRRADVQDHLAKRLAVMDAGIIRDMFENELPKAVEDSGLRNAVLNSMTQDKLREIFSEIGNWYRQIRAQAASDFEVVEHLNKFKSFLGKLLGAPASRKVPFAIYEELLNQGLLDEIPPGVEWRAEDQPLPAQVDRLLAKSPSALLEQPDRDRLPDILKKLCGIGLDELAQRLLEKFMENLTQGTPLLRQVAVKASRGFLEILWVNRKESLWRSLHDGLHKLADQERSPEVYKEIAEALAAVSVSLFLQERFPDALKGLSLLRRHTLQGNLVVPGQAATASAALAKSAQGLLEVLLEDLLSKDQAKKDAAQAAMASLGEASVPCFVAVIMRADDARHRRLAAAALRYYGPEAAKALAAEFHAGNPTPALLNLVSVLDDFLSPQLVPRLEPFLHFPDADLRRRVVQLAGRIKDPRAAALIVKFLEDKDESAQIEAARAAGEMRNKLAVPKLTDLLKSGSTLRREEICLSLGKIGDSRAVAALTEILETRSGLFKQKPTEETVRIRAAWALGQIPTPAGREALKNCLKDPNLQIQHIARQAIESAL